jgi:hypothetical protein
MVAMQRSLLFIFFLSTFFSSTMHQPLALLARVDMAKTLPNAEYTIEGAAQSPKVFEKKSSQAL